MSVTTLELKPDRLLMDSNFNGYKLSLEELRHSSKSLQTPVDKTFLKSSQYSLLHAKLFGLHNHLIVDQYDNFASLYFVDQQFNVQKIYVDTVSNELVEPVSVFSLPKPREQTTGDYNVTIRFASAELAVISDGMGTMYVLATRDKKDDDEFHVLYSGKVLNDEEQGFVVSDAVYNDGELHVVLLHIKEDVTDRFVSVVNWLTFKESQSDNTWGLIGLRQLQSSGEIQYAYLEKNCEHIYLVSDKEVKFLINSEHPITKEPESSPKVYKWSQTFDEITIKLPLDETCEKNLVKVTAEPSTIHISYNSNVLLEGEFENQIDSSLLTWTLEKDNILQVILTKQSEGGPFWKELVKGDQNGEYIFDSCIVDQVNERLQKFTSDSEAIPQSGTTFNSQQIEECDFETDKSETFERFSGVSNKVTHKIHLGSHQVLLSPCLNPEWPPAIGLRHDVDVCLWQPLFDTNFACKHEGTLLAFGYVQASKTNRKFVTCSPNLEYAVISEASGHIFIYRQNKPLLATNLRHRVTGKRITNIAQQQVINLPNQDILGELIH